MSRIKNIKKRKTKEIKREAILPLQVLSQDDYLTAIVLSTLTFAVYAFTAAPGVTLADSGDLINGVLTLGIVHSPGYPLYTVLGHLFSLLPFGEPAFRVNLFSALWGSLCLGVLFLILRILSIEIIHSIFATLFLGFTTVYWSKTGVAEVYSFNGFLIACIVFWILSYNRDKKRGQLYLVFLTMGLALSNHYPLVILTSVGLVFLLDRRDLLLSDLLKGSLILVLGLTPYLYLFIQALNPDLEYNFGKNSDFGMVLDHILRRGYKNEFGGTVWDKFILSFTFLKTILTNFLLASLVLFFVIAVSFIKNWKYRYPFLIAALCPSLGLIVVLTFPSDDEHKAYLMAYLIPTFLFLSVFLSIGLKTLMDRYVKKNTFQVSLLIILLLSQVGFNFRSASHHNDRLVEIWGTELLNSLEPGSALILCSPEQFSVYYLQLIKGLGQNATLYDRFSTWTKANLYEPVLLFNRGDANDYRKRRERQLINYSSRPIYSTCYNDFAEQNIKFSLTPYVFRIDKRHSEASDFTRFRPSDHLLDSLVNGYPKSEFWLDSLRKTIFGSLIFYYGGHGRPEVNRFIDYLMKTKFYSDREFLFSLANILQELKNDELARQFYGRAAKLLLQTSSRADLAVFCNHLASSGDYDKALAICLRHEQSSARCDVNSVKSRRTIASIYKELGDWSKVEQYSRKVIKCQPNDKIAQRYLELARQRNNTGERGVETDQ